MRSARETPASTEYLVDISPPAWNQLATLSADDYGRIRARLDAIAADLTLHQPPAPTPQQGAQSVGTRAFVVDGYAVLYGIDAERGRLTLLEVARRVAQDG